MAEQTNAPREWRLLAERDMSVAEYLAANMRPTPAEVIAFHCQQAAEKYLKGALVIIGEEPPYIHDLNKLCKLAIKRRMQVPTPRHEKRIAFQFLAQGIAEQIGIHTRKNPCDSARGEKRSRRACLLAG